MQPFLKYFFLFLALCLWEGCTSTNTSEKSLSPNNQRTNNLLADDPRTTPPQGTTKENTLATAPNDSGAKKNHVLLLYASDDAELLALFAPLFTERLNKDNRFYFESRDDFNQQWLFEYVSPAENGATAARDLRTASANIRKFLDQNQLAEARKLATQAWGRWLGVVAKQPLDVPTSVIAEFAFWVSVTELPTSSTSPQSLLWYKTYATRVERNQLENQLPEKEFVQFQTLLPKFQDPPLHTISLNPPPACHIFVNGRAQGSSSVKLTLPAQMRGSAFTLCLEGQSGGALLIDRSKTIENTLTPFQPKEMPAIKSNLWGRISPTTYPYVTTLYWSKNNTRFEAQMFSTHDRRSLRKCSFTTKTTAQRLQAGDQMMECLKRALPRSLTPE